MKESIAYVFIGLLYIVAFVYQGLEPIITVFWTGTSMWACLFIIPFSAPLILNRVVHNRLIETIGKASYNIFLFQMVYYNGAYIRYKIIDNRALQLLVNIIACTILGLLFYYVETPITKAINSKAYEICAKYGKSNENTN